MMTIRNEPTVTGGSGHGCATPAEEPGLGPFSRILGPLVVRTIMMRSMKLLKFFSFLLGELIRPKFNTR